MTYINETECVFEHKGKREQMSEIRGQKLKRIDLDLIRSLRPCYDPSKYLPEDFHGTVIDILDYKEIPFYDRLWVIMRDDFVSEKLMRLFAVWCVRQVQHLMKDERSLKAIDVAEAFAGGLATKDDLAAAWSAASDAAWDASSDAASDAAWDAASDAARSAAWSAAGDAARSAAWDAAWSAAWDAAWSAARDADWGAARDAARDAASDAQEARLREMLIAGIKTGDVK